MVRGVLMRLRLRMNGKTCQDKATSQYYVVSQLANYHSAIQSIDTVDTADTVDTVDTANEIIIDM